MALSAGHIISIVLTLLLIVAAGVYSGKKVKNSSDFDSGGKSGAFVVAGAITGTLVGGSSTVGTAQLAYTYGMSAWWFTLGAGISCLILALFFIGPFRRHESATLTGMISKEFGAGTGMLASVLSSVGIFINLLAQLVAAQSLIITIFPGMGLFPSTLLAAVIMAIYVIFGGVLAAGIVGVVKLVLLYIAVIAAGILAAVLSGGVGSFWNALPHETYFNLFARGFGVDVGAGVSLLLGVLSTQTYAQAVKSGISDKAARNGALLSAFLIPPIGVGGILVGMHMKLYYPDIDPVQAFPMFILEYMPPLLGGIVLATLFIAVVGTGSGLSLGISSIINNDIIRRITRKFDEPKKKLLISRILILIVLASGLILTVIGVGDLILQFGFMSMGLRAAVVFLPMFCALFFPGRIRSIFAKVAIVAGPLGVFAGKLAKVSFDPLFIGMAVALVVICAGFIAGKKNPDIA
ncbi:MAG: sodium:solute symporter family protein [Oscillospiraceae bacterium]|jgi:SSS family solute:Na+ symporter